MHKSTFILPAVFRSIGILFLLCLVSHPSIAQDSPQPLELTVRDAILMALQNNSAFQVQLLNPDLKMSQEEAEKSVFDLGMTDSLTYSQNKDSSDSKTSDSKVGVQLSKPLATGGSVDLGLTTDKRGGGTSTTGDYTSKIELSLSQSLLKGAGVDIVLANQRKAHLSVESSKYELQGVAESLVSNVESTYWDYSLAERQLKIYEDSLALAERQLDESNTLIEVGKIAEIERVASEAEVANRREALINAKSTIEKTRLKLLQLINPSGIDFLDRKIVITDEIALPESSVGDLKPHIETALLRRPDLNQARLLLERNELDVMVTKNGLLPSMELFASLGMTGYADSIGSSFGNDANDFSVGLRYSETLGRRDSKERYKQSVIGKEQSTKSLDNLTQLAKVDVATAWIELNRTFEQITATIASRKLQEAKYNAEEEKYRVGKSTSLLVAQAARDLLSAQISETQSITNYQKAEINFLKMESTLLEKYGISFLEEGKKTQ